MEKELDYERSTVSEPRRYTIVSKIDSFVKIANDTTVVPFETIKVKDIINTPNHYKNVNVVVDDHSENQHCKDVVIIQQVQVLKPGSNKISVLL